MWCDSLSGLKTFQGIFGSTGQFQYIRPILPLYFSLFLVPTLHVVCSPTNDSHTHGLWRCVLLQLHPFYIQYSFSNTRAVVLVTVSSYSTNSSFKYSPLRLSFSPLWTGWPHWCSVGPCLKFQVIDKSKDIAPFILLIIGRGMFNHKKIGNSLHVNTDSILAQKKSTVFIVNQDLAPGLTLSFSSCKTSDGFISLSDLMTRLFLEKDIIIYNS